MDKLIKDFKASAYSMVVFKRLTTSPSFLDPQTKELSAFAHIIPIISMREHFLKTPVSHIRIVIDRMKLTEETAVRRLLNEYDMEERYEPLPKHSIEFRDSKSEGYELIQLADIISGLTRNFFENYQSSDDLLRFSRGCPLCNGPDKALCRRKRLPSAEAHHFFYSLPLYRNNPAGNCVKSLLFEPVKVGRRFRYLYCPKIQK